MSHQAIYTGPFWRSQPVVNGSIPKIVLRPDQIGRSSLPPMARQAAEFGERASVSRAAEQLQRSINPYSDIAPSAQRVKVEKWGSGNNDSLERILKGQGYSMEEIYAKDAGGKTLLDRVAEKNSLKNPDLIREGSELTVPSKKRKEGSNASPSQARRAGEMPATMHPKEEKKGFFESAGGLADDAVDWLKEAMGPGVDPRWIMH